MSDLVSTILNIPILQAFGVVLIVGLAERVGIPVVSTFKSLLKINGNGAKETPEWALQLKQHYNDDTTALLARIVKGQERMADAQVGHNKLDEDVLRTLQEFKEYGIPCRKEQKI